MKELFRKNKAVIRFLAIFIGCYLILAAGYQMYLHFSVSGTYYPDYITNLVARQSEKLIEAFGYTSKTLPHPSDPSMKLYVNGKYLVRIVEGCNGASVIILFISFVLAFYGRLKPTLLYILAGSVIVYVLNLIRIAVLVIGIYERPEYKELLHGTVFPAIIYGTVFLLWVVWVNYVTKAQKK